jgi:AbiV family abortive infection protein
MLEAHLSVSQLLGVVLGAAPGMEPRRSFDEAANAMIDTAEFLEAMGYDAWQLRLMATRWRWGEPTQRQYDSDVQWLQKQSSIAFRHMQGDRTEPLMAEEVAHIDHSRAALEDRRRRRSNLAPAIHAAHAGRRPPEYQLKVIEGRWEAAIANALDLIGDAAVLATAHRLPRALALSYFAIEELAKVPLLVTAAIQIASGEAVELASLETQLMNHEIKWRDAAYLSTLTELGYGELGSALTEAQEADLQTEIAARLAARPLRELSLYSDYRHGKVMSPSEIIVDQEAVDVFLGAAKRFLADISVLVQPLQHIAYKYSAPEFREQVIAAAVAWHGHKPEVEDDG